MKNKKAVKKNYLKDRETAMVFIAGPLFVFFTSLFLYVVLVYMSQSGIGETFFSPMPKSARLMLAYICNMLIFFSLVGMMVLLPCGLSLMSKARRKK